MDVAAFSSTAPVLPDVITGAGVILSSRPRSSSRGDPEALRAFLFGERLKNLRKAFKSMKRAPVRRPTLRGKSLSDVHQGRKSLNI